MRRLSIIALLLCTVSARAETPALLDQAVKKLIADENHWAFTQTTQRFDKDGKAAGGPTVERFDPSKPFDQEWQLLAYEGRTPKESELSYWQRQKQRALRRREEKSLGDVLDLEHATLAGETTATATFLVPIMEGASKRFPADQLEVFMDVNKAQRALTAFSVQPRGVFRMAVVLKVESGRVDGRLAVVKPNYAPTLVWLKGAGEGHLFGLIKVGMGAEVNFSDFQRVRPYNDRFEVKIGDVKALNF
jgi:hypothetical protein